MKIPKFLWILTFLSFFWFFGHSSHINFGFFGEKYYFEIDKSSSRNPNNKLILDRNIIYLSPFTKGVMSFSERISADFYFLIQDSISFTDNTNKEKLDYFINSFFLECEILDWFFVGIGKKQVFSITTELVDDIVNPFRDIIEKRGPDFTKGIIMFNSKVFLGDFDIGLSFIPKKYIDNTNYNEFQNFQEYNSLLLSIHSIIDTLDINSYFKLDIKTEHNTFTNSEIKVGFSISYIPSFFSRIKIYYDSILLQKETLYSLEKKTTYLYFPFYTNEYSWYEISSNDYYIGLPRNMISIELNLFDNSYLKFSLIHNSSSLSSKEVKDYFKAMEEDENFFYRIASISARENYFFSKYYMSLGLNLIGLWNNQLSLNFIYRINLSDYSSILFTGISATPGKSDHGDLSIFINNQVRITGDKNTEFGSYYFHSFVSFGIKYEFGISVE